MEAGDGRWGHGAGGLPCLLELETDTMGNAIGWDQSQSDQLYQGSGDKSLRAKAGAKCWLFTAACIYLQASWLCVRSQM